MNRSVLCNCGIGAENNFFLESLAACHDANSKLIKYFMLNKAFVNYLDQFDNLIGSLEHPIPPILSDKSTFPPILPISLNACKFDTTLLTVGEILKDVVHQYEKKIYYLKERHIKFRIYHNILKMFILKSKSKFIYSLKHPYMTE